MQNIPFNTFAPTHQLIKKEMLESFEAFFDSNYYVLGQQVKIFEQNYTKLNHNKYCIGVANGLDALHIALKVLGIGAGEEVIVPSNTYIATVLAISFVGATPIFVEPDIKTYNINPLQIEQAISPKTKAIMPVHLYGQACEMGKIMEIAKKYNLFVIEDNAQGHLATYQNQITGSFGDINATSFYPTKNLGALGDAGAITTEIEEYAIKCQTYRNYGSQKRYYNEVIGLNSRLDELQAALLNVKIKYLAEWTTERQGLAQIYLQQLQNVGDIILPHTAKDCTHVYHLFVIRTQQRDKLQQFLTEKGIGTLIHYPIPPHLQECYQHLGYKTGDFPIAEELSHTALSLPLYPGLPSESVNYICQHIQAFFDK